MLDPGGDATAANDPVGGAVLELSLPRADVIDSAHPRDSVMTKMS